MQTLVVVTQPGDWPLQLSGARLVTALQYLKDPEFVSMRHAKVFNLCRHYRYQALGYYVSLLAEARGHKPIPTVMTTQDLKSPALVRMVSDDLEDLIGKSLASVAGDRFTLHVYFGRAVDRTQDRLATAIFKQFTAPFLRARFVRSDQWELAGITAIASSAIPADDRDFAFESAQTFFARPHRPAPQSRPSRFDLAILVDPKDPTAPSDSKAIARFVTSAEKLEIEAEVIGREDFGRLLEFDALFIRVTTAVNHYSYRFARRAAAEGLVVIDDPVSILRCTNKVYLAELLSRNGVATPRTAIVHREGAVSASREIGFPCIVKQPDSSSSLGVFKAEDQAALSAHLERLFEVSDLVLFQEFLPTEFDWRIGVLDSKPIFAAKYFMASNHWQIIKHEASGGVRYGRWQAVAVDEVPRPGLDLAVKAAGLIGNGLYGVDLKEAGGRWVVIEVNDNPSVESGVEDQVLKEDLYDQIMRAFLRRLETVTGVRT